MDPAANFCNSAIEAADASQAYVDIATGDANLSRWPDPATVGAYNIVCWNSSSYGDPALDPNVEIMRATALSTRRLTVTRAQESTSSVTHNASGCTHRIALAPTKKLVDDLETAAIDVGSVWGYLTEYGAHGDGVTDDHDHLESAIAALTHIVIPSGTWRLADDVTVGTGITLEFRQGAVFSVDTGKTLTINGPIIAGNWQIFSGSGTVTIAARGGIQYDRWDGSSSDEVQLPAGLGFRTANLYLGGKQHYYGTTAPASGTWAVGDICYNTAPDYGEFAGWSCVTAGTPGTWVGWGSIDKRVESAEILVEASGVSGTAAIAHGLGYTPAAKDISISCYTSTGTGSYQGRMLAIVSTDGTNVNVGYETVDTTDSGTKMRIVARIHAA